MRASVRNLLPQILRSAYLDRSTPSALQHRHADGRGENSVPIAVHASLAGPIRPQAAGQGGALARRHAHVSPRSVSSSGTKDGILWPSLSNQCTAELATTRSYSECASSESLHRSRAHAILRVYNSFSCCRSTPLALPSPGASYHDTAFLTSNHRQLRGRCALSSSSLGTGTIVGQDTGSGTVGSKWKHPFVSK